MLVAEPIGPNNLEPYATLLASSGARRTEYPAVTEAGPGEGAQRLAVVRFEPSETDGLAITRLERHPYAAQTFIPVSVGRFVVVVAPTRGDGSPDGDRAKAFLGGHGHALIYHRDVWHASMVVLDAPAEMAVVMWRRTAGDDTIVVDLPEPLALSIR